MLKSGNYHIIDPDTQLIRERVRCHQQGSHHRHQYHIEEKFKALCEKVIPRENCCNAGIANPNWNYDWCHDCVKAIPWTEDGKKIWLERHGIDTHTEEAPQP